MKKIAIILVNYCNAALTIDCIKSIKESTYTNYEIIIVDNASTDNSVDILKQYCSIEKLIISSKNLGFAGGNNLAIRYAIKHNFNYILLLNNDTVIDSNMLMNLVKNSDKNTITVPKMYYFDYPNKIWYAGGDIDWKKCNAIHRGIGLEDKDLFNKEEYVTFATGCCILFPRKTIERIGLLNDDFFMYFEDFEYSIRLLKKHIKIKYIPSAKLWHKVGATSGAKSKLWVYYNNRNRFYILKNYKFSLYSKLYVYFTRIIKFVLGFCTKTTDIYILKAYRDYRRGIVGKQNL